MLVLSCQGVPVAERQRRHWDLVRALCVIFPTGGGDHHGEDDGPAG